MTTPSNTSLPTLAEATQWMSEQFLQADIDQPRMDARLLTAHAAGVRPQDILMYGERPLNADQWMTVQTLCCRRCQHEPVSRIIGQRGFWTLDLSLNADTLDPRPDTETLIEAVLDAEPERPRPLRIIDFGTGTGCILLALLSEYPNARGLGVDISPQAVAMARHNAQANGLAERATFMAGDWGQGIDGPFDVLVSNPPYIAEAEMAGLDRDVTAYDPYRALVSGPTGFEAYETLIPQMAALAAPGALLGLEAGAGQAARLLDLLKTNGCDTVWTRPDLGGILRCTLGRRP